MTVEPTERQERQLEEVTALCEEAGQNCTEIKPSSSESGVILVLSHIDDQAILRPMFEALLSSGYVVTGVKSTITIDYEVAEMAVGKQTGTYVFVDELTTGVA